MKLIGRKSAKTYPVLPNEVKAANVKILCYFLGHIAPIVCTGDHYSRIRTTTLTSLAAFLHTQDNA
eukprot:9765521-Alexandrium_andersonii.AAC.1